MSVKIRLSKTGKTHQVSYRVVAQDTRTKRDGKFLEKLGFYNPSNEKQKVRLNLARVKYWISKGAKPTTAVKNLLEKDGKTS